MTIPIEMYGLSRNPFPPAAAGIDVERDLYMPETLSEKIEEFYNTLSTGEGAKAFPVIGEYGSGKTTLLKGYLKGFFEEKRIMPFYFENPGVQFYDLANTLMRNLGRVEFSKSLWEMCKPYYEEEGQRSLFPMSFTRFLNTLKTRNDREKRAKILAKIVREKLDVTTDEEIAYKIALIIVETARKPYFEYRDFEPSVKTSLVPEREEPKFFNAIIKSIFKIYGVEGVVFLIDEFEDVVIPKRMPRSKSYEYLATLRHLIDVSAEENFWIVIAMTPEAAQHTKEMGPALWERFTHDQRTALRLEPLTSKESKKLIRWWLDRARDTVTLEQQNNLLFPFPENLGDILEDRPEIRYPRPLTRMCFSIIARAQEEGISPPISLSFIQKIVDQLYPSERGGTEETRSSSEMLE